MEMSKEIPSFIAELGEDVIIIDNDDDDEYGLHWDGEFVHDCPTWMTK